MKRKLFVTHTNHHYHVDGSNFRASTDPCLIRVVVEARVPEPGPGAALPVAPGIRSRAMAGPDRIGEVMVAMPPGVNVSTHDALELGRIAASWVRAELAKRGLPGLTIGGPAWLELVEIPAGQLDMHPDDPGDGVADMD